MSYCYISVQFLSVFVCHKCECSYHEMGKHSFN